MSKTLQLTTPITSHGEETYELNFRAPLTKDQIELGFPTLLIPSDDGRATGVEVRLGVIAKYVSRLAGITAKDVEKLSLTDFQACIGVVMGFFQGEAVEATTNSPETPTT